MKFKLSCNFTDLEIAGKIEYSPFLIGDEIEIISIKQQCSDLGCCEVRVRARHPDFNDGKEFFGFTYFSNLGLPEESVIWE